MINELGVKSSTFNKPDNSKIYLYRHNSYCYYYFVVGRYHINKSLNF